jgi:hypothetical protein
MQNIVDAIYQDSSRYLSIHTHKSLTVFSNEQLFPHSALIGHARSQAKIPVTGWLQANSQRELDSIVRELNLFYLER